MPTVNWVEGVSGEDCIRLQENANGAAVLTVHNHVDEHQSAEEQELLITQLLLHARLGASRQVGRLKTMERILSFVLGIGLVLVASRVLGSIWLAFLVAFAAGYAVMQVVHVVLVGVWVRRFFRRSDQALAEVAGRDRVVAWLKAHLGDAMPTSFRLRLRWLRHGAPPSAAGRLRMLGKTGAAA
jgi:cytochrome c biogenesis protein CcdA